MKKWLLPLYFLLFLLALIQTCWSVGSLISRSELLDFSVFYRFTRMFLEGGNPYAPPLPFNYPPSFLFLLSPLAVLPQRGAEIAFTGISLASLICSVIFLNNGLIKSKTLKLLLLTCLLLAFPTKFTLGMGQVNLITLFFLSAAFYLDQKDRQISSGIFWSLAIMTRITPVTLGLFYLLRKKWTSLGIGLGGFCFINVLIIMLKGWQSTYFLTALPGFYGSINNAASYYDQSLHAFLVRLGFGSSSLTISSAIIVILIASSIYLYIHSLNRQPATENWQLKNLSFFSLILALTTIGNSYAWFHHLVFLYPGFIAVFASLCHCDPDVTSGKAIPLKLPCHCEPAGEAIPLGINKKPYIRKIIEGLLSGVSFLLIGLHFPDANTVPDNPFIFSHALIGSLLMTCLLLIQLPNSTNIHQQKSK